MSTSRDTPILAGSISAGIKNPTGMSAGTLGNSLGETCGTSGSLSSGVKATGWSQTFQQGVTDNLTGKLELTAVGTKNTLDSNGNITGSSACSVSLSYTTAPTWTPE